MEIKGLCWTPWLESVLASCYTCQGFRIVDILYGGGYQAMVTTGDVFLTYLLVCVLFFGLAIVMYKKNA